MNLLQSADDPSLLQHEPLRTFITAYESMGDSRSNTQDLVSRFAMEMQEKEHIQVAAAAKRWAHLLFNGVPSEDSLLEAVDGGKELYTTFFRYQLQLSEGLRHGNASHIRTYQASIFRKGIAALKLKDNGADARRSNQGKGRKGKNARHQGDPHPHEISGPTKVCHHAEAGGQLPDRGDIEISSSLGCGSHSTMGSAITHQNPPLDARSANGTQLSGLLPEAAKPNKRSTSKKKQKRRASSQKPPVITPSDASEDDKEPSKSRVIAAVDSVDHRSKRVAAPSSCPQPHDSLEVKHQVNKNKSTRKPKTSKQYHEGIDSSQPQPPLTSLQFVNFVFPPSVEDNRDTELPLHDRKDDKERISSVSSGLSRASSNHRKLQKTKSDRDLQNRTYKRLRRTSISAPDGELGEGSMAAHDVRAKDREEGPIQRPIAEVKARRKRTRPESETGFVVVPDENALDGPCEPLGPDPRLFRPLPQKVCGGRPASATEDNTTVHGVTCGTSSLEHTDQLVRDMANNALARMQDGARWDTEDWTQDEEHDVECNYLDGHDDDEANDDQVTTATSAPSMVIPKPPVPAPPRIWAQSRQEVCESLEYFRSYHSGVYSKSDVVKGYLLGAHAASRDIFHHGGKLIVSHGGGKSEAILDVRGGIKRYQTDQDQEATDKSVRALLKTRRDRRPIVLLADDKYALFPYDLASANYTYVVLGLYWISHAWAERQSTRDGSGFIVRWKFAFQWCEGQGNPWWAPQGVTSDPLKPILNSTTSPANTGGEPSTRCESCHEHSPFIYKQGWTCMNPHCSIFWSIGDEDPKQLDYREEFLALLPLKFGRLPNVIPAKVAETPGGVTTTYAFSKGWHCAKCGRLSCRYKWEHWECANCHFKQEIKGRIRSPKEFWHQRPPKGFLHSQIGKDSGILACRLEPVNLGEHKGFTNRLTFILPHDRGKIHLILGSPLTNGDADDIFRLYQKQASTGELKLRRYPLQNHRARGLLLSNYFSQNSGEPYQYVGGSGNTIPFCEAPDCVQRALALIKERSRLALHIDFPFNEILTAAYMERQKMSFHSDSEKGLGPTVASLSLGSAALMHFRLHVSAGEPKSKSPYALTLVLRHGDVLVMEGEGVQKYYEHTVVPMNFRIAATARCIGAT